MARRQAAFLLVALLTAGALAGGVFARTGGTGSAAPTPAEYVGRVNAICGAYGKKLDAIPPPDTASPGSVYTLIGLALPVLREEEAKVRALRAPIVLRPRLYRFFQLTDRSLAYLERARAQAGKRELAGMMLALSAFERTRSRAKLVAISIGFRC